MKFLVTGGSGFIGSTLVKFLLSNTDSDVLNFDKLTYASNQSSLESIKDEARYKFVQGDISHRDDVEKLFKDYLPDIVINLAAESHVDNSINESINFINTNILGTYNLLEVSRTYYAQKNNNFLFHHVSTDEVYGDLPHPDYCSLSDSKLKFSENTPYKPSSPYSSSKACSDHLVNAWFRTYGLPTLITNCSNNYGPFQHKEKLIPQVICNAINNKKIPIYGKGNQIRDWLFVEDHAEALYLCATKGEVGESYNIGGNNEIRNIDVVNQICEYLDENAPEHKKNIASYKDLITFVDDRPGHDYRYAINASKIENKLGWKPKETFNIGIKRTIDWYLENINLNN